MALTKFNYNSFDLTTVASTGLAFNSSANGFTTAEGGALNLITTNTISSGVSSSSFTSGIDSTYDSYLFKCINIHPATNNAHFTFQGSTNGGSSYGLTITSAAFSTEHNEADSSTDLSYQTGVDLAQSTNYQRLTSSNEYDNDNAAVAYLYLFSPSNTTFVKHFIIRGNTVAQAYTVGTHIAGYFNTTSAINAIDFKMSSGNIDSGVIKMYGITK